MRGFPGARSAMWVVMLIAVGSAACGGREPIEPADTVDTTPTMTTTTTSDQAAIRQGLMTRWNATVDAAGQTIDFHWYSYDQFPHPTFKGGTIQAFQQFAAILLAFFQRGDDFDFMASNHLFTAPVRYVYANGQIGLDTTFQQLAMDFSSTTGFGNIPATTRQGLQTYLNRIQ